MLSTLYAIQLGYAALVGASPQPELLHTAQVSSASSLEKALAASLNQPIALSFTLTDRIVQFDRVTITRSKAGGLSGFATNSTDPFVYSYYGTSGDSILVIIRNHNGAYALHSNEVHKQTSHARGLDLWQSTFAVESHTTHQSCACEIHGKAPGKADGLGESAYHSRGTGTPEIDIGFIWTTDAVDALAAGFSFDPNGVCDDDAIAASNCMIAQANLINTNSSIDARFNAAFVHQPGVADADFTMNDYVRGLEFIESGGAVPEVPVLERVYRSDLSCLVMNSDGTGLSGKADLGVSSATADGQLVTELFAGLNPDSLVFTHEVGHTLGMAHGGSDPAQGYLPYARGYATSTLAGTLVRSVMTGGGGSRVPYHSGPSIQLQVDGETVILGIPIGQVDEADSVSAIGITAPVVASYRTGPQLLDDCNANGQPDLLDIFYGVSNDCNGNEVPDSCDIALDPAIDCNYDGLIDDCQLNSTTDCDSNGVLDACEIALDPSLDCDSDGVLDACQTPWTVTESDTAGQIPTSGLGMLETVTLLVPDNRPIESEATLEITMYGRYQGQATVDVELNGVPIGTAFVDPQNSWNQCADNITDFTFSLNTFPPSVTPGFHEVILTANNLRLSPTCPNPFYSRAEISYLSASPYDADRDGVHDCADPSCNAADVAEPYGTLNFFDINQFTVWYNAQDPRADIATPLGAWNFFDFDEYLARYNAGCP